MSSRYGSTASNGVSRLERETDLAAERRGSRPSSESVSPSSTCTVRPSAPAVGERIEQVAGIVDHQMAVEEERRCAARSDFTTGGPIERFGT